MTATLAQPEVNAPRLLRFTVDQYHRMIEQGILLEGSPYELINGLIVAKDRSTKGGKPMTVGGNRAFVVQTLLELLIGMLKSPECHARFQNPIAIPPDHEPEPDALIVRGTPEHYRSGHPGPRDVICVIEVADSSLKHDRTVKQRIYADAGIPQYVIVNLVDRVVEVYTEPSVGQGRYAQARSLARTDELRIHTGQPTDLVLRVAQLLP